MHPFLKRLGVPQAVQSFISPNYSADQTGQLLFRYGQDQERYGFAFHRLPDTVNWWMAGQMNYSIVREVLICHSAMEVIATLSLKCRLFEKSPQLLCLASGPVVRSSHLNWLLKNLSAKSFTIGFDNSLLGRIADIKIAAGIHRMPVAINYTVDHQVNICFRYQNYQFVPDQLTLNAFEKATGFRTGIKTIKSKTHDSFLAQLQAGAKFHH